MKVRRRIYFRCAQREKVFSAAHADALEMRSHAKSRTCPKTRVPEAILPRSSALYAEHVLTGVRDLVGAARGPKTPVCDENRKPFGYTTPRHGRITKHA